MIADKAKLETAGSKPYEVEAITGVLIGKAGNALATLVELPGTLVGGA